MLKTVNSSPPSHLRGTSIRLPATEKTMRQHLKMNRRPRGSTHHFESDCQKSFAGYIHCRQRTQPFIRWAIRRIGPGQQKHPESHSRGRQFRQDYKKGGETSFPPFSPQTSSGRNPSKIICIKIDLPVHATNVGPQCQGKCPWSISDSTGAASASGGATRVAKLRSHRGRRPGCFSD